MQFSREERYYILKISDMRKYLGVEKQEAVRAIAEKLNAGRIVDKKNVLQAVVVESDWPEYDAVWDMIEARVTGALKLKGPTEEESVGPADTASKCEALRADHQRILRVMSLLASMPSFRSFFEEFKELEQKNGR